MSQFLNPTISIHSFQNPGAQKPVLVSSEWQALAQIRCALETDSTCCALVVLLMEEMPKQPLGMYVINWRFEGWFPGFGVTWTIFQPFGFFGEDSEDHYHVKTLRWKGVQCHVFEGIPLLHLNLWELFSGVTSRWDSPRVDDWFDQFWPVLKPKPVPHLPITQASYRSSWQTQQRKNSTYLYTVWSSSMNFYCLNSYSYFVAKMLLRVLRKVEYMIWAIIGKGRKIK